MKRLSLLLIALFTASMIAYAQQGQTGAILTYADDESLIEVKDSSGKTKAVGIGSALLPGDTIRTTNTSAELTINPSGSMIKLAENTTFRIDVLARPSITGGDTFTLANGKLRVIAARAFAGGQSLSVSTPTAVGGVRGTDFAMSYRPTQDADWICVTEGTVRFTRVSDKKQADVSAGKFLRTSDSAFVPSVVPDDWLKANLGDLAFRTPVTVQ